MFDNGPEKIRCIETYSNTPIFIISPFGTPITLTDLIHSFYLSSSKTLFLYFPPIRPEPHGRGGSSQPGQTDSPLPEQDEEILGSDDDEQEDPNDYCRGKILSLFKCTYFNWIKYSVHV